MISKGNLEELRRMMPLRDNPGEVPESIVAWIVEKWWAAAEPTV